MMEVASESGRIFGRGGVYRRNETQTSEDKRSEQGSEIMELGDRDTSLSLGEQTQRRINYWVGQEHDESDMF